MGWLPEDEGASLIAREGLRPIEDVTTTHRAYMLGISPDDHIVLAKGPIGEGLPLSTSPSAIRSSPNKVNPNTWLDLRLEAIVNTTGDVVLRVLSNDLTKHPFDVAVLDLADGMAPFVDDSLGANSGSPSLVSGYLGFAGHVVGPGQTAALGYISPVHEV